MRLFVSYGLSVLCVCTISFSQLQATRKVNPEELERTVVVAHRGLIKDAPENTLAGFRACLELGFGFELDVQRTADGHLMCLHDTTVDRTTDGKGPLAEMTRKQAAELDTGSWFSPRFHKERMPGIDEVFELIAAYPASKAIYAVDIKLHDKRVEAELVALARKYKILDRLLFIGNTIQDEGVRQRLFAADRSVHMAAVAHDSKELVKSLAHPRTNWVYVRYLPSREEIEAVHRVGKRVFIAGATVAGHEQQNWQHCIEYGVDAILTDYAIELGRQIRSSN